MSSVLERLKCSLAFEVSSCHVRHNGKGVILSNHGGRALDAAATPIQTLLEIRIRCPNVLRSLGILIDGGVKQATDVVKALCLRAQAIGLG